MAPSRKAPRRYTLRELDGGTELLVEMDTTREHEEMFQDVWPKALERLKALAVEEDRRGGEAPDKEE